MLSCIIRHVFYVRLLCPLQMWDYAYARWGTSFIFLRFCLKMYYVKNASTIKAESWAEI